MVTHTPRLLHSSPSLSSLPPLSFLRLRDLSHPLIWPDMHNVKNSTDAEQGQAGWLSCLTEKWLADVKLSNWKEWNMVIRAGESLCFCLWALVCSWRTMDWHLYMFFFLFRCACLSVWMLPGWPAQVFLLHFQLHASLSHGLLLLAATAKGNSWACADECTTSAMFSVSREKLKRWDYMNYGACVFHLIHASFSHLPSMWYCFL